MKKTIALTKAQQILVEENLPVVAWAIRESISAGKDYDDLYQEGCLWLCRAAQSFDPTRAQFSTYAKKVVRNGLLSFCRRQGSQQKHTARLSVDENGDMTGLLAVPDEPSSFDTSRGDAEVQELLHSCAGRYSGVARLGIEALSLKVKGMSVSEIAALYDVPPSHVGAWISRGKQKLRADRKFLDAL